MRIELHRDYLSHTGKSEGHIDAQGTDMIARGVLRLPPRLYGTCQGTRDSSLTSAR